MGLVFGAILSISTSLKSDSLFKSIKTKGAHETVNELSWQDFEFLLSEWFKKQGFNTDLTGGGGADGGVDIRLHKQNELYLVQCKHYKAWKVSVQVVRELFGVMAAENAVGGYVVTSGKFTRDAIAFAEGKNITLIDGNRLEEILDSTETIKTKDANKESKACPRCGSKLVERNGRKGKFSGCNSYPKCRYTEDLTLEK
jgi:restriction system protein